MCISVCERTPSVAPSRLMQAVKGKTSHHLLSEYRRLKREFWGRHLWARGYFVCSSGNVTDEMTAALDARVQLSHCALHSRVKLPLPAKAFSNAQRTSIVVGLGLRSMFPTIVPREVLSNLVMNPSIAGLPDTPVRRTSMATSKAMVKSSPSHTRLNLSSRKQIYAKACAYPGDAQRAVTSSKISCSGLIDGRCRSVIRGA